MRREKESKAAADRIRGGLFGGAVGDALGYPVKFQTWEDIIKWHGFGGIRSYILDERTGKALVSDDTQMSLFTAAGVIYGDTQKYLAFLENAPSYYVWYAYLEWLSTQTGEWRGDAEEDGPHIAWLLDFPRIWSRRAPGNTCMSALRSGKRGSTGHPVNDSKGCGGVMRVAPLALYYDTDDRPALDMEGAEIAALTHGHPLGYMPGAVLTHIVNVGVYGGCTYGDTLEDAVREAVQTALELFVGDSSLPKLQELIDEAVRLSKNDADDVDNIRLLGEGWVAEETLAIAIYCSLRYQNDFSGGVTAAVNHSGDSDSTGAVTGNILGAWLGYDAIEEKWKDNLELKDVILEMADDLCHEYREAKHGANIDLDWIYKYIKGRYVNSRLGIGKYDPSVILYESDGFCVFHRGKVNNVVAIAYSGNELICLSRAGTVNLKRYSWTQRSSDADWTDIKAVFGTTGHFAGLKQDGTVVAAGWTDKSGYDVSDWCDIAAVSGGFGYTLGLRKDGTVVAVGKIDGAACDVSDWKDIVCIPQGGSHIVGLRKDGTVAAIGKNEYGQCDVSDWRDIVDAAVGQNHTAGLRKDGTVIAVGNNQYGQCDVSDWHGIKSVFCKYNVTVGLRENGTVVATGENKFGQCNVEDWQDIIDISVSGYGRMIGLKKDGTVAAVGRNHSGQCNVERWRDVISIACSMGRTTGLRKDGTVLTTIRASSDAGLEE